MLSASHLAVGEQTKRRAEFYQCRRRVPNWSREEIRAYRIIEGRDEGHGVEDCPVAGRGGRSGRTRAQQYGFCFK